MTTSSPATPPWKISLHGGHSSRYCDHAHSTLEEMLEAAIAYGYRVFGVTEHAPRLETSRLYAEEIELGWNVDTLDTLFTEYAETLHGLAEACAGRLTVLRGFEAEVVPEATYPEIMHGFKERFRFDYMVGSVHYVAGAIIDYTPAHFERAAEACGGIEALGVRYYRGVAEMVERLRPDVVGHFDIIRRGFPDDASAQTRRIRAAALEALEAVRDSGAILDINTSGYRKGLGHPFPAPVFMEPIRDLAIPVCFGDDSHSANQVGDGVEAARNYLLEHGINAVTILERGRNGLNRNVIPLVS